MEEIYDPPIVSHIILFFPGYLETSEILLDIVHVFTPLEEVKFYIMFVVLLFDLTVEVAQTISLLLLCCILRGDEYVILRLHMGQFETWILTA